MLCPLVARAASSCDDVVRKWYEAAIKAHSKQEVARMLKKNPKIIGEFQIYQGTPLHLAAYYGHELVVTQLLTDDFNLAHATDGRGRNALHLAAESGHAKVVAVLLANFPSSINAVSSYYDRETCLHSALRGGHYKVALQLLAVDPTLASAVNADGATALHCAARTTRNKAFLVSLLELNPKALRAVTQREGGKTPFDIAVVFNNDCAIDSMQGELFLDEIMGSFTTYGTSSWTTTNYEEQLAELVGKQCECLSVKLLNRDVMRVVFDYLGLATTKTTKAVAPRATNNNSRIGHKTRRRTKQRHGR